MFLRAHPLSCTVPLVLNRRYATTVSVVALLLSARTSLADTPSATRAFGYSGYEKETISRALASTHSSLDPLPSGKVIESIETVRLEVFEDRDPIPNDLVGIPVRRLVNGLHAISHERVIRREMLFKEGDVYDQDVVDEMARNMRLRMPMQVSVVVIVPTKGTTKDKIKLLVITKDIWSLRLSFDLSAGSGGLEKFLLVPQETNLFGLHHTAQATFLLQPASYTVGLGYKVPRFGNSWVGANAAASVTMNRQSGAPEGSGASLAVSRPLFSTRTSWAWTASVDYSTGIVRRYVNAHTGLFNSKETPNVVDNIPTEYKSSTRAASVGLTRSFGVVNKNNFGLMLTASHDLFRMFNTEAFDPRAVADFEQRFVPVGEDRVYPTLSWTSFSNTFLRTLDIGTLALQEDYRLGHDVGVAFYPVAKALGSTRDLIGVSARASYSIAISDGLVRASVASFAEDAGGEISDGSVSGAFTAITPRLGIGRIVMNASFVNRYKNYLRSKIILGGDERLRGYPSNFFFGKDAVYYNLEFRSTSVELLKFAFGAVAFFDAGDAAQGFTLLHAKQSVGVGLRALLPQLNRLVFRADLAFPMQRGPFPEQGISSKVNPVGFFFAFDQAFSP
jgi:hypothetical protein